VYWFWRDRKGMFGNPLSLFSNLLFAYGGLTCIYSKLAGIGWGLSRENLHLRLLLMTLALQLIQTGFRLGCSARIYGFAFALGAPLRTVCCNWINSVATVRAVYGYLRARLRHEPLVWLKTEHAYPTRNALVEHKRKLGEILVGSGYVGESELRTALETQPAGLRLGEHLLQLGKLAEEDLYVALCLQQGLPGGRLEPRGINTKVARALPRHIVRDWRVLPFQVATGSIFLASPEIPTDELSRTLRGFTRLSLRFHLVTPENFAELTKALL